MQRRQPRWRDQGVMSVQGGGLLVDGHYAELPRECLAVATAGVEEAGVDPRAYRRVAPDGGWRDSFLCRNSSGRWVITTDPLRRLEAEPETECTTTLGTLDDLPGRPRSDVWAARTVYKTPPRLTKWRPICDSKNCKNADAHAWGLATEAELYGHLCMYHRREQQYYDMQRKLWSERIWQGMRNDLCPNLLEQFEAFMRQHKYELTTERNDGTHHARHIRYVVDHFRCPLTVGLADDVLGDVEQWDRNIKSKGHHAAALGRLMRWAECRVVSEAMATRDAEDASAALGEADVDAATDPGAEEADHNQEAERPAEEVKVAVEAEAPGKEFKAATRPHPAAAPCAAEPSDAPPPKRARRLRPVAEEGGGELPRLDDVAAVRAVAQAHDPCAAILAREGTAAQLPGARQPGSSGQPGPAAGPAHGRAAKLATWSDFAELWGKVAGGNLAVARLVAACLEKQQPEALSEGAAPETRHSAILGMDGELLDACWIWAYCGVRDREPVLSSLAARCAPELLKRLLTVAWCHHRPPADILRFLESFLQVERQPECIDWANFEKLAAGALGAKRFRGTTLEKAGAFVSSEKHLFLRLSVLGGWLGKRMADWPGAAVEVTEWWSSFCHRSVLETTQDQEWCLRAALATGFHWNWDPDRARERLLEFARLADARSEHRRRFVAVQQRMVGHVEGCATGPRNSSGAISAGRSPPAPPSASTLRDDPGSAQPSRPPPGCAPGEADAGAGSPPREQPPAPSAPSAPSDASGEQPSGPLPGPAPGQAEGARPPATPQVGLSAEQQARIRRNREEAVARKKAKLLREQQLEEAAGPADPPAPQRAAAGPAASPQGPVAATPAARPPAPAISVPEQAAAAPRCPNIAELDLAGSGGCVQGTVEYRRDHSKGGGFTLRIRDGSGAIDVKVWCPEAENWPPGHPALQRGSAARLAGFKMKRLVTDRQVEFAPAGRRHELVVDGKLTFSVEVLPGPAKVTALSLMEAMRKTHRETVDIASAQVVKVEGVERRQTPDGVELPLRVLWLSPDEAHRAPAAAGTPRVRWTLWGLVAEESGDHLRGARVAIRGAMIKAFNGRKTLTGCQRDGGITRL